MIKARNNFQLLILFLIISVVCKGQTSNDYLKVIKEEGVAPIDFVEDKLETFDLIIFDDALHSAVEPFIFYQELIHQLGDNIDYVFIEVFGINAQPNIDAYLNNATNDYTLLLKVFQDDFTGFGWRYETTYNLLSTIWDYNHQLTGDSKKINVIGVDQPIYWEGIHTRQDYDIFLKSLIGRDYFMYKMVMSYMKGFTINKKGIFLTNTRHAYKNMKLANGTIDWNCGTFFYQWHPNKTYSIRIHNVTLSLASIKNEVSNISSEGLEKVEYHWVKMENGKWDEAFKLNNNLPVAVPLQNNVFGYTKYVGNNMLNVYEGQNMFDAYDALIFLAALDNLHFSASIDFIYTEDFKNELKRRIEILHGDDLDGFLNQRNVATIEEYIDQLSKYKPQETNDYLKE